MWPEGPGSVAELDAEISTFSWSLLTLCTLNHPLDPHSYWHPIRGLHLWQKSPLSGCFGSDTFLRGPEWYFLGSRALSLPTSQTGHYPSIWIDLETHKSLSNSIAIKCMTIGYTEECQTPVRMDHARVNRLLEVLAVCICICIEKCFNVSKTK